MPTDKALATLWFETAEILGWPRVGNALERRVMLEALKVMLEQ